MVALKFEVRQKMAAASINKVLAGHYLLIFYSAGQYYFSVKWRFK
jgi:hypothetical protein